MAAKPKPEASFEEHLVALEKVVGDLEGDALSLEASIDRYKEGVAHLAACRKILDQAEQIARSVPLVEARKYADELQRSTQEIHRLENEGDDLLAEAVATLYDGVTEVPQLIKAMRLGDIYQLLEDATDKAEAVAVVLQNIAVKNA